MCQLIKEITVWIRRSGRRYLKQIAGMAGRKNIGNIAAIGNGEQRRK